MWHPTGLSGIAWENEKSVVVPMEKQFTIIGGDRRQRAAAGVLEQAGFTLAFETGYEAADYLLLPMSASPEQLALLHRAVPGAVAFGGRVPRQETPVPVIDYYRREELIRLNAVPTAEGCIGLLLQNRCRTLWQSPLLVLGFGRVAQAVALRCQSLGARVTVAARSPEARAWAAALDLTALPLEALDSLLPGFDAVVNTIPAPVLGEQRLRRLPPDSLVVDLASSPGGTDLAAAKRLGIRAIPALGLPGKWAPVTAGELIGQTVLNILRERGELA